MIIIPFDIKYKAVEGDAFIASFVVICRTIDCAVFSHYSILLPM